MPQADDLAVLWGLAIGLLFYTCVVLGCVKVCQCPWLVDDVLEADNIGLPSRLLPGGDDGSDEEEVVGARTDGPQDV